MVALSVVIPAYNEQARLPGTLDAVLNYLSRSELSWELVVVDDGSSDGTVGVVEQYSARYPAVRLLRNPGNRGKGYAVRNGMLAAHGEWILFTDADLSAPIEEFPKLLSAAEGGGAAIAIGSRAVDRRLITVRQSWMREQSGKMFNLFMRTITGLGFLDTQCGFKLYRADAAREVFSRQLLDGFSFDVEDLVIAKMRNIPAVEVPVRWSNAEGSKVSLGHGMKAFGDVLQIRWNALKGRYS